MNSAARLRDDLWVSRTTSPFIAVATAIATVRLWRPRPGRAHHRRAPAVLALGTALSTIRLVAAPKGLTVAIGPWGWPSWTIQRAHIAEARAEPRGPAGFGGWGLRWRPGSVALMLRSGPALVLTDVDGRELVFSTDDPEGAVRALNQPANSRT